MTEHGFLAEDARELIAQHRQEFAPSFAFAERLDRQSHSVLKLANPHSNLADSVITSLFIRILSSHAAMVRLIELGLASDAGTILRSCIEATIYIQKCSLENSWIKKYILVDEVHRAKTIKRLLEKETHADFANLNRDTLLKKLAEIKAVIGDLKESDFNVEVLARDGGLTDLYEMGYRYYSTVSTHSSARSISKILKTDAAGEITHFYIGPEKDDFEPLFFIGSIALLSATTAFANHFKIDPQIVSEMNREWEEFFQNKRPISDVDDDNFEISERER